MCHIKFCLQCLSLVDCCRLIAKIFGAPYVVCQNVAVITWLYIVVSSFRIWHISKCWCIIIAVIRSDLIEEWQDWFVSICQDVAVLLLSCCNNGCVCFAIASRTWSKYMLVAFEIFWSKYSCCCCSYQYNIISVAVSTLHQEETW